MSQRNTPPGRPRRLPPTNPSPPSMKTSEGKENDTVEVTLAPPTGLATVESGPEHGEVEVTGEAPPPALTTVESAAATKVNDEEEGPPSEKNDNDDNKSNNLMQSTRPPPLLELIGPAYARDLQFWRLLLFSSALQGCITSLVGLGFFLGFSALKDATWKTEAYEQGLQYNSQAAQEDPGENDVLDVFRLGQGPWWYVALLSAAGLAVGLLKVFWQVIFRRNFPRKLPGFLDDIAELEYDDLPLWLVMILCSILSIGPGAVVGPEACLGLTGTALGTLIATRWQIGSIKANSRDETEDDEPSANILAWILPDFRQDVHACALDGLMGAFGPLFPAQVLSPLLVFEVGTNTFFGTGGRFHYTEQIAKGGVAASISYVIFTSLKEQTFLATVPLPAAAYDFLQTFEAIYLLYGAILGLVCGVCGFLGFFMLAIGQVLGIKVYDKFKSLGEGLGIPNGILPLLATPTLGGAIVGLLCVASPLILSDGTDQLGVLASGAKSLGVGTLICSAILKLVAVGVSLGFGFVGGQIFPLIFAGCCIGAATNVLFPSVPLLLSYSVCMAAAPCAFVPLIFSFTLIASLSLVLGGPGTAPIFLGSVVSYTTVCGMGLVQDIVEKAAAKKSQ